MASIYKRNKTWSVVVSVPDGGTYKRKTKGGFKTKKDAEKFAFGLEVKKLDGESIIGSTMSFADYFELWMKQNKKGAIKESSYRSYKYFSKHVKTLFGTTTLEQLTKSLIQAKIDEYGTTRTKTYTKKLLVAIKECLRDAYDDGLVTKLYAQHVKPKGLASKEEELKFLQADEFELLQAYLYQHPNVDNLVLLIALETGMRYGEIIGLHGSKISKAFNAITTDKQYNNNVEEITSLKTKSSRRSINVTQALIKQIFKVKPNIRMDEFVFPELMSRAVHSRIQRRLTAITKEIGIKQVGIHHLRHSHASYLIAHKVAIGAVSKRLGHASIGVTLSTYAHILDVTIEAEQTKTLEILAVSPEHFQQFSTNENQA